MSTPSSAAPIAAAPTASQKRAQHPDFIPTFSMAALRERLPFLFPVPPNQPPSPKSRYRSAYGHPGYAELALPAVLATLSAFEVALRLIDFTPLRDYLAQIYVPSTRGQVPFDPVSLFLCILLRRELHIGWRALEKLLAGEHGAGWRRCRAGDFFLRGILLRLPGSELFGCRLVRVGRASSSGLLAFSPPDFRWLAIVLCRLASLTMLVHIAFIFRSISTKALCIPLICASKPIFIIS